MSPPKYLKKRLSQEQVRLLEASFDAAKKLEPERKLQLANQLGVSPRQVAIWYQNKRVRWKNHTLELDCAALQLRLDAALADKRQLLEEAERLRCELKRAQDLLLGFGFTRAQLQAHEPQVSPPSGWAVYHDVANRGEEEWPIEEVYSCLMLGGD